MSFQGLVSGGGLEESSEFSVIVSVAGERERIGVSSRSSWSRYPIPAADSSKGVDRAVGFGLEVETGSSEVPPNDWKTKSEVCGFGRVVTGDPPGQKFAKAAGFESA